MKNTFGSSVALTLFGESHGQYIGATLDGLAPGITIDHEYISHMLTLRRPSGRISTQRRESDQYRIISGVREISEEKFFARLESGNADICAGNDGEKQCGSEKGSVRAQNSVQITTGAPLTILIPNENVRSSDYSAISTIARPSHADYAAECKYHGFQDSRGGGHFSGRLTAALVAAGAVCKSALEKKGILIGTHVKKCAGISDREFGTTVSGIVRDIKSLNAKVFATLSETSQEHMREAILEAATQGDSVGGVLETAVIGMPHGVGEPWFDAVESLLAHMLFSIPAVKGVEFGAGFALADMRGSVANDPFAISGGKVVCASNNNGGINGGITNGMPIIFRTVVKPTPTIYKLQETVDFSAMKETVLQAKGRHDPAIVHRARVVQDAASAIVFADALAMRFGTDWLASVRLAERADADCCARFNSERDLQMLEKAEK